MAAPQYSLMTEEEYLRTEVDSPMRREYVQGVVYAMAGGSRNHERIARNILFELQARARGSSCEAFGSNMKVEAKKSVYYYPDASLACGPQGEDPYVNQNPCLVVEVLSPCTADTDRREKLANYRLNRALQAYWIVHQDQPRLERHFRDEGGAWQFEVLESGKIAVPCLDSWMTFDEVYEGVR